MSRILVLQVIAAVLGGILARGKGRNPFVWGLLCFFVPLLVLAVLVLPAREAEGITKRCPSCSRIVSRKDGRCKYCKQEFPIELVQCAQCGSFVTETEECPECHKKAKP